MLQPAMFKGFSEYWYYTRYLSDKQREIIFNSLSSKQKQDIENSYMKEGWSDVLCRNEIDKLLDKLKGKYGYDVLDIRAKVLKGKSCYVPTKFWELLTHYLSQYRADSVAFITSGLESVPCEKNKDVVLIVSTHGK